MNVALPTLVIFLLLLPGFIFRSHLKRAERSSLDYSPFGQVVAEAVLWSIITHFIWIKFVTFGFHFRLEPITLIRLLGSDPPGQAVAMQAVAKQFNGIASYFGTLLFASFLIPLGIRQVISAYRLDRSAAPLSPLLRFHQAPWYYLLTLADFKKSEEPDFIVVSAVVEIAGHAYLYTGILDEFVVDTDGRLDRLMLLEVVRRPIDNEKNHVGGDAATTSRFNFGHSDYFVLRYSDAITLNVDYVVLTRKAPALDQTG